MTWGRRRHGAAALTGALVATFAVAAPHDAFAQRATVVSLQGVTYDSLRSQPLAGAFVMLMERGRSAVSDERGRFRFDSVPPGAYTVAMQHAVFDSLGLSGASTKVTVTDGKAPVLLSVPSFPTLWRAVCAGAAVPARDTGFVYGTIRGATDKRPVPQGWVEVTWLDVVKLDAEKKSLNVTQRRWKSEIQGDAQGGYAVCGVPLGTAPTIRAFHGTNTTPAVTLPASMDAVRRVDLLLNGLTEADAKRVGVVRGAVTDTAGRGIKDIRVAVSGVETRTDENGRFTLRGLPTGTNQIEAQAVGFNPVTSVVDVYARDTSSVTLQTYRLVTLDTMKVRALSALGRVRVLEFEMRRKQGFGTYLDSLLLGKRATLSAAFQSVPNLMVENLSANGRRFNLRLPSTGGGYCLATLVLDGVQQNDTEFMNTMNPSDLAAIEVYQQRTTVPAEFIRAQQTCGAVVVWTKRAFK